MKRFIITVLLFAAIPFLSFGQKYENGLIEKSVAIVGNDVIMLSDIEDEAQMMRARGYAVDYNARCEILEQILTANLYLTQARLDSLEVNSANVEANLNARVDEVMAQLGGEQAVEDYFGKPLYKLKSEWEKNIRDQTLIQQMQSNVANDIPSLTPADIKDYIENTPEEDLPIIPTKYRIRQIGIYPDREAAAMAVRERLLSIRERVINGEKFSTLARMYSQDPGSASRGGELGMAPKSIYWPEFSDAAMSLKVGQVSQVVETPDGYHIIELVAKEGDMFNARHILLQPKYTTEDQEKAFRTLDSLKTEIQNKAVTFELAARFYSEDPATKTNGGQMADPNTGSSYFEIDQLKPQDYNAIRDLNEGEISDPVASLDNEGRSGNLVYKILRVDKIIPAHEAVFENDFTQIADQVLFDKQSEAIDAFLNEKIKSTFIIIDPLFADCEFENSGWSGKFRKE